MKSSTLQLPLPEIYSGKRVWVSGHTGFKGSWLCEWLLDLGAEVHGFALAPTTKPALFDQLGLAMRVHHEIGDVRDAQAVRKSIAACRPDFVFHLAAQPLVRLSYDVPVETFTTNVMGTVHVLEALRTETLKSFNSSTFQQTAPSRIAAVLVTTDKCYENREWLHGYREEDALGGFDPYSSSKAACELAIASWRRSFFHHHPVRVVSARAGNVIGGGDWAADRIVPDTIRSLIAGQPIPVRNKVATRPWQHVLEPLGGYLTLAATAASGSLNELLASASPSAAAFNFGPPLDSNRTVSEVVEEILPYWPGSWEDQSDPQAPHEAGKLNLTTDKAFHVLGWQPRWDFSTTIAQTVSWYRRVHEGANAQEITRQQISEFAQG